MHNFRHTRTFTTLIWLPLTLVLFNKSTMPKIHKQVQTRIACLGKCCNLICDFMTIFCRYGHGGEPADPAWGCAYTYLIYDMYKYYGDTTIVAEHYAGLKFYVDFLTTFASYCILESV